VPDLALGVDHRGGGAVLVVHPQQAVAYEEFELTRPVGDPHRFGERGEGGVVHQQPAGGLVG